MDHLLIVRCVIKGGAASGSPLEILQAPKTPKNPTGS